jgi:anaerobic magnesium-protoporphyrin IX monomethyl ester cyclase
MSTDLLMVYLPVDFGAGSSYGLPPLGCFYLATEVSRRGHDARVLDACIEGWTLDETIERIKAADPRIIGISGLTPHLRSMREVIARLVAAGYKDRIVCGGPHFNDTKGEAMDFLDIDFAMYGECDRAFGDFVDAYLAGEPYENISNLIYRDADGQLVTNPQGNYMDDLDELPFPNLALGNQQSYEMIYGRERRAMSIMGSRGCPYLCTFCDVFSVWGRKVRFRTPKNVVDEIIYHRDTFGITEIFFRDSVFTLNYKWLDAFLDELESRDVKITWHCNARVDRVTEPLLRRMKKLGLYCISYGVESGNDEILSSMKKGIDIPTIEKIFKLTTDIGLQANGYFMVGNPGETKALAEETLDLALRLPTTFVDVGPTVAYPGTETYRIALRENLISDPKWYMQDKAMGQGVAGVVRYESPGQLALNGFSPDEQFEFCRHFIRKFYFRPQSVFRIFIKHFSVRLVARGLRFLPIFLSFVLQPKQGNRPMVHEGAPG